MMNLKFREGSATNFRIKAISSAITLAVSLPVGASVLEEVIITAQKREQNLQDVGVSVAAFSGNQMENLGWTNSL